MQSTTLCVCDIPCPPGIAVQTAWMVPAQEFLWRQPMLSDIQPVLKAIQAGVRREVAMKRTAEVLVWLVLFTAGDQALTLFRRF